MEKCNFYIKTCFSRNFYRNTTILLRTHQGKLRKTRFAFDKGAWRPLWSAHNRLDQTMYSGHSPLVVPQGVPNIIKDLQSEINNVYKEYSCYAFLTDLCWVIQCVGTICDLRILKCSAVFYTVIGVAYFCSKYKFAVLYDRAGEDLCWNCIKRISPVDDLAKCRTLFSIFWTSLEVVGQFWDLCWTSQT